MTAKTDEEKKFLIEAVETQIAQERLEDTQEAEAPQI